jgi:DNA polymerase III subunit gamma/tau
VPDELSLTPEADDALRRQAERVEHTTVIGLLELLGEAMEGVRAGADARTRLELALVKAARPETDGSMRALLARIELLEHAAADDSDYQRPPQAADAPGALREQAIVGPPPLEAVPAAAGAVEVRPAAATPAPAARELETVRGLWPAVVDLVRSENGMLAACIVEARPVAVDGESLTLAFASTAQFLKKKAEDPSHRAAVGEALGAVTGVRWRLTFELSDELATEERPDATEHSEEEWVARFMREFDAEEVADDWEPAGDAGAQDDEPGAEAMSSREKGA